MLHRSEIISAVKGLQLPDNEYWVSTGAGLVIHGVKDTAQDIDVGCAPAVIDMLLQKGYPLTHTSDGNRKILCDEVFEFFENWFVDETVLIDDICVASLLSIRKQKLLLGRKKDFDDIAMIDAFMDERRV